MCRAGPGPTDGTCVGRSTSSAMRSLPVGWPGGCGFNQSLCQHSSASHAAWWWPLTLPGMTTPGNRLAGRRPLGVRAETSLGQMCKNCCSQSSARTWELQRPLLPSSPERKTGKAPAGPRLGGRQAPLTPGVALGYTGRGGSLPATPAPVSKRGGGPRWRPQPFLWPQKEASWDRTATPARFQPFTPASSSSTPASSSSISSRKYTVPKVSPKHTPCSDHRKLKHSFRSPLL